MNSQSSDSLEASACRKVKLKGKGEPVSPKRPKRRQLERLHWAELLTCFIRSPFSHPFCFFLLAITVVH